jgi:hypothetical protein
MSFVVVVGGGGGWFLVQICFFVLFLSKTGLGE